MGDMPKILGFTPELHGLTAVGISRPLVLSTWYYSTCTILWISYMSYIYICIAPGSNFGLCGLRIQDSTVL